MSTRPVVLELHETSRDTAEEAVSDCPLCEGQLAYHQPDELDPDHLLAVCPSCGTWFLVGTQRRSGRRQLVRLPGFDALLRTACPGEPAAAS